MKAESSDFGADFLCVVKVRFMDEHERELFDQLLRDKDYLHTDKIGGRHLRYVVEADGRMGGWAGLLTASGTAPHLKAREQWIGWSPRQRARRQGMVVNNSRFLLLVEWEIHPNLASKVIGMTLRRLCDNWREKWGHPVLLLETFVDESHYRGPCYRACGFQQVGVSAGL